MSEPSTGTRLTSTQRFRFAMRTGQANGMGSCTRSALATGYAENVATPESTLPMGGTGYGRNATLKLFAKLDCLSMRMLCMISYSSMWRERAESLSTSCRKTMSGSIAPRPSRMPARFSLTRSLLAVMTDVPPSMKKSALSPSAQ